MKYTIALIFVLLSCVVVAEDKFVLDNKGLNYDTNVVLDNSSIKLAVLFPIILLGIAIIMVRIDFMSVGVCAGSLLALIVPTALKILPLSWSSVMGMVVLTVLMIYEVSR
jgi:hypothetical protein